MVKESVLAGILAFMMLGNDPQQGIPDAPKPQALPSAGGIAPGSGTTPTSNGDALPQAAPGSSLPSSKSTSPSPQTDDAQGPPPEEGIAAFTLRTQVNFVQVPFTVKDSKGVLMPGLNWRDIQVFENGYRRHIETFTVDPFPLSVALVIDQSLPFDTMTKVNNALGAMTAAFAPYDEVAVLTYNNGPKMQTTFTAAQSARLAAVLEQSKSSGREGAMNYTSGPLANNVNVNNGALAYIDPNTNSSHGTQPFNQMNAPKEVHTLNDAILAAGVALSKTDAKKRRRIIYVISDGKEFGSKAKFNDVKRYLQTNQISVWATLVGDSSVPGLAFMDRMHIPYIGMRDNILPLYASATGGQTNSAYRTPTIETSFQKITEEVRTMYTVGYYSRESSLDSKFRTWQVDVLNHGNKLDIIVPPGYYPMATAQPPAPARPPAQTNPQ